MADKDDATKPPAVVVVADISEGVKDDVKISATYRINFAFTHIQAASRFSRMVGQVEREHEGEELGEFYEDLIHYSTACLFTAAAGLEAYINEIFADRHLIFKDNDKRMLDKFWEMFEEKRTFDKFETALWLLHKPKMNKGISPYQDAQIIIDMRNSLMHFKPEWDNEDVNHRKLSEKMRGKFKLSPFIQDDKSFPRRWATHGGTKWIVENVLAFIQEFERVADLPQRFHPPSVEKLEL